MYTAVGFSKDVPGFKGATHVVYGNAEASKRSIVGFPFPAQLAALRIFERQASLWRYCSRNHFKRLSEESLLRSV